MNVCQLHNIGKATNNNWVWHWQYWERICALNQQNTERCSLFDVYVHKAELLHASLIGSVKHKRADIKLSVFNPYPTNVENRVSS